MDEDLPKFEPVGPPLVVSDEQILHDRQLQLKDTGLAKAEALCHAGDALAASTEISQLLQAGTDVQNLQFCLLGAVLAGSQALVWTLLHAGVPVRLVNIKPAIRRRDLAMLCLFLQHGWDINESEDWCIPSLLSYAIATSPDESLISWFLSNGADPNARCEMDITPLSTAVGCAPLPVVQQLFEYCSLITSFRGQLLHWAARRASDDAEDVLQFILERSRQHINKIMYEDDPFSYAVREVVGLGTALHEAARIGRPGVAQLLLQNGADVSIPDSCGNTALEVAELHDNHATVVLLRNAEKGLLAKI